MASMTLVYMTGPVVRRTPHRPAPWRKGVYSIDVAKHLQDDGAQEGVTRYGGNAPLDVFATRKGAQLGVDADAFILLARAVVPMRQDELVFRAQDVLEGLVQGGLDVNVHATSW